MKKGIVTVFIILGILVLGVIIWGVIFNGGLAENAANAVANPINDIYGNMVGDDNANLINGGADDGDGFAFNQQNNLGDAKDQAW